jgi:hypothetical protein
MTAGVLVLQASVISGKRTLFAFPDNSFQTYAWYVYAARDGALWDQYQRGGHAFLGELISSLLYPLQQGLFVLTGSGITGRGMTAFLIAHMVLAALFTYAFLRAAGLVRPGAVVGGLAYAMSGYMVHRLGGQAQIFISAVWVPAMFWLFHLAIARALWIAAPAGAAVAMSLLAGHIQPPAYALIGITAYGLFHALTTHPRGPALRRTAAALAITLAMGFALSAPQMIPSLEYQDQAVRFISEPEPVVGDEKLPYETVGHKFLLEPHQLDAFLTPVFDDVQDGRPYAGILTLLLAAFGLARAPRRWAVFWGGFVLVALLYSLGHHAGVHRLGYELVPLLDKIREPVRALMMVHFGLAVLAAYGAAALTDRASAWRRERRGPPPLAWAIGAVGAVAVAYVLVKAVDGEPPVGEGDGLRIAAALAVAGLAIAAGRLLGWLAPTAAAALCVAVLVLDLAPAGQLNYGQEANYDGVSNVEPHQHYRETDVIRFIRSQPGPFRVSNPTAVLPPNSGDVHAFEMLQGHGASMTQELFELLNTSGAPPGRGHDLMNVRYAAVRERVPGWRDALVSREGHGRLAENPAPLPRAWIAGGWEVVPDWKAALHRTLEESFPYRRSVVLDEAPDARPPARLDGAAARIVRRESGEIEVESRTPAPAVLVMSELHYPGWSVEVDGRERRLLRADGILRAVEVPAGVHRVTMSYRPTNWTLALALCFAGLAALVAACAFGWRGARRRRP